MTIKVRNNKYTQSGMLKQLGSTLDEFVFRFIQFPQATWMYALKNTGEKKLLYYLHWKENASKQRLSATKLRDKDTKPEFHIRICSTYKSSGSVSAIISSSFSGYLLCRALDFLDKILSSLQAP